MLASRPGEASQVVVFGGIRALLGKTADGARHAIIGNLEEAQGHLLGRVRHESCRFADLVYLLRGGGREGLGQVRVQRLVLPGTENLREVL